VGDKRIADWFGLPVGEGRVFCDMFLQLGWGSILMGASSLITEKNTILVLATRCGCMLAVLSS